MGRLLLSFVLLAFITICHMPYAICTLFAQDKIIAIVNKDVITEKDLNDFINFMRMQLMTEYKGEKLESKIQSMKLDLLDKLIEDRLILQEAKKNNIQIDESRVKARIDEIKKEYDSEREFQNALSKQGLVQADIESKIRQQFLTFAIIDSKIRSKIIINPAEVTDFYQENTEQFKLPEQKEFEVITADNEELAKKVQEELKNGQGFQEVARKYQLVTNKLNTIESQLREDIQDEISKLRFGEISQPINIDDTFYIFKLDRITASRQQSLSETQENIYTYLFNKKMSERLTKWVEELKERSYIQILQN